MYPQPNLYQVVASYTQSIGESSETIRVVTMISVQEQISNLRIDGPTAVPNYRYNAGTDHR